MVELVEWWGRARAKVGTQSWPTVGENFLQIEASVSCKDRPHSHAGELSKFLVGSCGSPVLVLAGLGIGGLPFVSDLRLEAVDVVGGVGDDLGAAVGQRHLVAAPRHVAAPLLVLLEVGARPRVSHTVREAIRPLLQNQE